MGEQSALDYQNRDYDFGSFFLNRHTSDNKAVSDRAN